MGILIKNVTILTMNQNKEIIDNGVVVIDNNIIQAVGNETLFSLYTDKNTVIDGKNGILIPGMVNAHTHVPMILFRSLADDVPDRLKKYIFPLEKKLLNQDFVRLGAQYAMAEMLLAGVSTFADMYYFENEVAQAAKELNIRAVLGETIINFPAPDAKKPYGGLEYCQWFIDKWKGDDLIIPAIAPHAIYTNDSEHLLKAASMAEEYNVPLMMHLAEMDYEVNQCQKEHQLSPVEYLANIGFLTERLTAAHLVHASDHDLDLLAQNNVGVSHNVGANSKGAKGVAPAALIYNKGMRIGLGTDGPMSGNTLDIISQMSLVGKIHKLFHKDRRVFPAVEIVEMATIGGARALHLEDKIGSVEPGKLADLVIFETQSINMQPIYDYYSVLVYSANPSNVDTVIINGKILVSNKRLNNVDVQTLSNQFKEKQRQIVQQI